MQALRSVPNGILRPPYAATGGVAASPPFVVLQDKTDVDALRRAGQIAREMLEYACSLAVVGRSTESIDAEVHDAILARNVYPAPLNYRGFPKSLCAAVNNQICHGIPDSRCLREGDIVKFDVSVFTSEGYFGDNCATVIVGPSRGNSPSSTSNTLESSDSSEEVETSAQRLARATREAISAAIETCRPGGDLRFVGSAIHSVADAYGYESVEKYCGHGIGRQFHMLPFVQHFRNDDALLFREGMVFTIEPMLVEGSKECKTLNDGWTVVTVDGGRAAQYEHMVAITAEGCEVLTAGSGDTSILSEFP